MKRILVLLATMVMGVLLASGVALAAVVTEAEPNNSATTDGAQAIAAASFDLIENANITDSTTVPHATVNGTGNDTFDYYSFTVSQAGTTGTFDIDSTEGAAPHGYDAYLRLFNSSGTLLASSDDTALDPGSTDDSQGLGSTLDPYISHTFSTPGTYYIEVGSCCVFL